MAGEKLCCPLALPSNLPLQHHNLADDDEILVIIREEIKIFHLSYIETHALVVLETWPFTTLLINRRRKNGMTAAIFAENTILDGRLQEKTVNLDKRCGINVTFVTNTNCAAETNTSVHSSESGCFVLKNPPLP